MDDVAVIGQALATSSTDAFMQSGVGARYRKLGNTGFDVSTVGFGTWQIGGGRWKSASRRENINLLREACDLGVNVFDAAVVYGQYVDELHHLQSRSQELLGEAFCNCRSKVFFCAKVGQYDELSHRSCFDASRLVDQVKQSLRRLKTDVLDICLIHAPSLADVKRGAAIEVLRTLQALGMVRAVGYSFENEPDHVREALRQRVDVIMLQHNLIDLQCSDILFDAGEHGVGILVGGPYKRGYLSGSFRDIQDLPMDDDYWRWNLGHNAKKVVKTLEQARSMADEYGNPRELRRAALRFVLNSPGVSSAIVGHRSIDELRENLGHAED